MDSLGDIYEEEGRLESYNRPECELDVTQGNLDAIRLAHELED
jgi:hypothetical protein